MSLTANGIFGPGGLLESLNQTDADVEPMNDTDIDMDQRHGDPPKKKRKLSLTGDQAPVTDAAPTINLKTDSSTVCKTDLKSGDVSPQEAVFAIDHLLESILAPLRNKHLTKARLVSHRFYHFASQQLSRNLKVIIAFPTTFEILPLFDESTVMTNAGRHEKGKEAIEDLVDTLKTSNNKFPCTSFNLYTDNLSGPQIQKLFTYHGVNMKMLKLSLNYITRTTTEEFVLQELRGVLMDLVPNLEALELNAFISMSDRQKWQQNSKMKINSKINSTATATTFFLPNLKSLNVLGISVTIFEELMSAAVNLRSYVGHQNDFLNYFISGPGQFRLYLLKHLNIVPSENSLDTLETIAELMMDKEDLNIELFHISLKSLYGRPDLWPRASTMLSKLLKNSASSVREMYWEPIRFLTGPGCYGLKIAVMPKVTELVLLGVPKEIMKTSTNLPKQYFPNGFEMSRIFPALKSIIIFNHERLPGFSLTTLLDLLNLGEVKSVRTVHFKRPGDVPVEEKELFGKVFTNAKIMSE